MASFGGGLASGLLTGYSIGRAITDQMNKSELADAMKAAMTEERTSRVEVDAPDPAQYTKDSETGNYVPSLAAVQSGVADSLKPVIEPKFETKTERVDRKFASQADRRQAMLQSGIDFWTKKGDTDRALDLQDKLEQSSLRQLQVKAAKRADAQGDQEEKDREEYRALSANFAGSRIYKDNAAAMANYDNELAAYQERLRTTPDAAGPEPQKPALRAVTALDQLKDAATHMQFNIAKGKATPVEMMQFQQMAGQVKKEVSSEAFKLLHAGDVQGAVRAFEAQGDMKIPEGAAVSARKGVYVVGGQKVPTNELVVTLPNGRVQVFNGLQGLDALDSADKVINTAFKGAELDLKKKEVGIHGAGLALRQDEQRRANEKWAVEKPELEARSGDAAAQRAARQGMVDAIETSDAKTIEKARQKAIAAGVKLEKPSLEFTTSMDQMGNAVVRTNKDTGEMDIVDRSTGAVKNIPAPGKPANVAFKDEAEVERARKAGLVKPGDVVTVGGRPARIN